MIVGNRSVRLVIGRMMSYLYWAFSGVIVGSFALMGSDACHEVAITRSEVISRVIVLCPKAMSISQLGEVAKNRLAEAPHGSKVRETIVSNDENELKRSVYRRASYSHYEAGFDVNLRTLFAFGRQPLQDAWPIVRAAAIGENVVLQTCSGGTNSRTYVPIETQVVKGNRNPFYSEKNSTDLIWIEPNTSIRGQRKVLHVFAASDGDLSCQKCRGVVAELGSVLGDSEIESFRVRLRRDTWFDGEEFPLIFRFRPPRDGLDSVQSRLLQRVPTVDHYYYGQEVRCTGNINQKCVYSGRWLAPETGDSAAKEKRP